MKARKETRAKRKPTHADAGENKQPEPTAQMSSEEIASAYEALRQMAIRRAEEKRNEPGGEGRLSLLQRTAFPACADAAAVCVDVARGVDYFTTIEEHGFNHITFSLATAKDKALCMVYESAKEFRDNRLAEKCLAAFSRLLEGNNPNIKAVLAGMEHLCGHKWQRGSGEGGGGGGGAKIVYNIQLLHAPRAEKVAIGSSSCENRARIAAAEDIIEVES